MSHNVPIEKIVCSEWFLRFCEQKGIATLQDISLFSEKEFSKLPGCGRKTMAEASGVLRDNGLFFTRKYDPPVSANFQDVLTVREKSMLAMVACGETFKFVAGKYNISAPRVREIVQTTYAALSNKRHQPVSAVRKDCDFILEELFLADDAPKERSLMTVDEALEFAREWTTDKKLGDGTQGWRMVCKTLAEEVERNRRGETICIKCGLRQNSNVEKRDPPF